MVFEDRRDAGRQLAARLAAGTYRRPIVLALPRGGVPVGREVADGLHAPLDVLVVRKLGCPGHPELGVGALGEGGVQVIDHDLVRRIGLPTSALREVARAESAELGRRLALYREGRPAMVLEGRDVLLVDDGLATGSTARAAIEVARRRGASSVVLAVPVGPTDTVAELRRVADEVVCLESPAGFVGVGAAYVDFQQVTDAEVRAHLREAIASRSRQGI